MNPSSPVDQIKERLSIAEVVGSYVKLERAGANFKARCPFHNERTPSFFVSPSRGTYHCFGCSRGGDIFSFVEEIEGLSFADALKTLADKAGVTLRAVNQKQKSEYEKLYALLNDATSRYEENLRTDNEAMLYLKKRGLTDETIKSFRLGFAKDSWSDLYEYLKKKGYTDGEMDKAGFIVAGNKGYYDRFRGRIMFPLSNSGGKIVGFSGRIHLPYDKKKEEELAKYVNSPETVLYNKSRILYGYDKAKTSMLRENTAVLVEGQMDLIMSHQSGITNTIALSGTALTEDHLQMIKRFADKLILALDSDEAGFAASEKAWRLAVTLGLEVRVATIPEGMDPADYALKDPDGMRATLGKAEHIIDYLLGILKSKKLEKRTLGMEVSKKVLPYVAAIGNKMDQAHFVGKISNELGIAEDHIWEEVAKQKRSPDAPAASSPIEKKSFSRKDFIARKIKGLILWQAEEAKAGREAKIDLAEEKKKLKELAEKYVDHFPKIKDDKDLIFESEVYYSGHEHLDREFAELLLNLEREILEEQFGEAMRELSLAEEGGKSEIAEGHLRKCQEISKKINELKTRQSNF